jgi:hypothetical protein
MKINQSVAGSLGISGLQGTQNTQNTQNTKSSSAVEPIKPTNKPTLQSSSAPVEASGTAAFLKLQSESAILPQAVQEVSEKPVLGKIEISQFKPAEVEAKEPSKEAPKGDDAIDQLKQSVNQDILIAMANSGSILS